MLEITQILAQVDQGEPQAAETLLPVVYHELRRLAAARLAQEKPGQTLQATALVHEAYLRLIANDANRQNWQNRGHFFAAAAEAMRRILVEQARRKAAIKRGGQLEQVPLNEAQIVIARPSEVIAVHDALDALEQHDSPTANLVKLHYFGGFSLEEAAEVLGMSRATGYRLWTFARAWLRAALEQK